MQRSRPFRAASFLYAIICRELELSAESAVQGAMGILLDEGAAVVEDVLRHGLHASRYRSIVCASACTCSSSGSIRSLMTFVSMASHLPVELFYQGSVFSFFEIISYAMIGGKPAWYWALTYQAQIYFYCKIIRLSNDWTV